MGEGPGQPEERKRPWRGRMEGGTAQRVGVPRLMHPFPFSVSSPEAASLPGQPLGDGGQRGSRSLQQPQPPDPEPSGSWLFPERSLLCPTPGLMLCPLPAVPTLRRATQFLLCLFKPTCPA